MLLTGSSYLGKLLLIFTILYSHFLSFFFSFSHFSYVRSPLVGYSFESFSISVLKAHEKDLYYDDFLIFLIICGTNYLFYIPESFSSGHIILPSNLKLNYTYI